MGSLRKAVIVELVKASAHSGVLTLGNYFLSLQGSWPLACFRDHKVERDWRPQWDLSSSLHLQNKGIPSFQDLEMWRGLFSLEA